MTSPLKGQRTASAGEVGSCGECQYWKTQAEAFSAQAEQLGAKLADLQMQHNDEIDVLNRTVVQLRKEMKIQNPQPTPPRSPNISPGGAGPATPMKDGVVGADSTSIEKTGDHLPPPAAQLEAGRSSQDGAMPPRQATVVKELGPNPNQLGDVVLSAFSPPCEASEGSAAQVEEFEWRREVHTERWFEASVLQVAVARYAEAMRERRKEKEQLLLEQKILNPSFDSQTSEPDGGTPNNGSGEAKPEKKRRGIFSRTLWGDDDTGSGDEDKSGSAKKRGNKRGTRKPEPRDEQPLSVFVRLAGNQPEASLEDEASVPKFSSENLSPALQKEFDPTGDSGGAPSSSSNRGGHRRTQSGDHADPHRAPPVGSKSRYSAPSDAEIGGGRSSASPAPGNFRVRRQDEVRVDFFMPSLFGEVAVALGTQFAAIADAALDINTPWRLTESPGKSEAKLYYFSHFVIKTLTDSEMAFAEETFFDDYSTFVKAHTDTFLPHFVGIFTMTRLKTHEKVTFMMSNNVLQTRCYVSTIYDLKGSTVGREGTTTTKVSESSSTAAGSDQVVTYRTATGAPLLKDNDLPEARPLLQVGPVVKAQVLARLRADTSWLEKLGIIDYSLLVGLRSRNGSFANLSSDERMVSNNSLTSTTASTMSPSRTTWASNHNETTIITGGRYAETLQDTGISSVRLQASTGVAVSSQALTPIQHGEGLDGGSPSPSSAPSPDLDGLFMEETYYIGLIDVFQQYSGKKKLENFAKGLLVNRHKISVVPPDEFAQRLCVLLERISS